MRTTTWVYTSQQTIDWQAITSTCCTNCHELSETWSKKGWVFVSYGPHACRGAGLGLFIGLLRTAWVDRTRIRISVGILHFRGWSFHLLLVWNSYDTTGGNLDTNFQATFFRMPFVRPFRMCMHGYVMLDHWLKKQILLISIFNREETWVKSVCFFDQTFPPPLWSSLLY